MNEPALVEPTVVEASPTSVLQTHGLVLNYGSTRVVNGLNLNVHQGEIYGFLGRNGAGKTSTMRMLMGIVKPTGGQIELWGQATRRLTVPQKQRIGYVSQYQYFYGWMTGRRLGKFVRGFYPTWDDAEFLRLAEVLDVPLEKRVSHLSGGTRVKLALALALAHRPALLLLDEPTAGLDPVARREFLEIIARQARTYERTTIFSTHLIDEVERVADRVGVIHRGALLYEGDLPGLKNTVREVSPLGEVNLQNHPALQGFQVLRRGFHNDRSVVLRGTEERWATLDMAEIEIRFLSLEDVFIALAADVTDL